jgi:hypothetical protein
VHEIVVRVDYDFSLNLCYQDLKALLDAKEKLEEYTREMKMVRWNATDTTITTDMFDAQTHHTTVPQPSLTPKPTHFLPLLTPAPLSSRRLVCSCAWTR